MANPEILRIGTRASKLALAQAHEVKTRLMAAYPDMPESAFEIVAMTTTGDRVQDKNLNEIGGKGLFTKEIEEALLAGTVDIAVHSMKDMPNELPEGLIITCLLEREDPRDCLLSHHGLTLETLPHGAKIGTSSLRRAAQMKHHRADLQIIPFRGNVQTRLRKLEEGVCDATLLAVAGLKRLGLDELLACPLVPEFCLPAIAQGVIGIECKTGDANLRQWLSSINHKETELAVTAERSLLKILDGSCRTPIGGLATISGALLALEGLLAKPDGSQCIRFRAESPATLADAHTLGQTVGRELLAMAGTGFLACEI